MNETATINSQSPSSVRSGQKKQQRKTMEGRKKVAVTIGHDLLGNPIVTYRKPINFIVHLPKHIQTPELLKTTHPAKVNQSKIELDSIASSNTINRTKRYACDQCAKTYRSSIGLKDHINSIHQGVRAYACNQCEKRFFTSSNLNGHMVLHTGEKPFACEQCNRSFSRRANLKKHCLSCH